MYLLHCLAQLPYAILYPLCDSFLQQLNKLTIFQRCIFQLRIFLLSKEQSISVKPE